MPIVKPPLVDNCSCCKKELEIKFVPSKKAYSHKNDLDFWTEKEEDKGKRFCDKCFLYLYRKRKWQFRELVTSEKKRETFRKYVFLKLIIP